MWQLIKLDYLEHRALIGMLLLFSFLINILPLPILPLSTYILFFVMFIAYTFYYDHKDHVIWYIVSLPVKKNHIVLARYLFILTGCTLFIIVERLIFRPVSLITFLFIFTGMCIAIAASIPIYYLLQSIWNSVVAHAILIVFGALAFAFIFISPYEIFDPFLFFIFDMIDLQPVITLLLISASVLYGSYLLSSFIFLKKDIT
ncbi:ABC-2 transporter permease [Pseudogracilibacillus sp. SO30301A]|uniref:ABC-2 transporter permease n=1 Tax=Pseudogracilibacillus sp. SO30301A TaxID=3098291 RepID=UPI00300E5516